MVDDHRAKKLCDFFAMKHEVTKLDLVRILALPIASIPFFGAIEDRNDKD
jgi:hypothetical protein